MTYDHWYHLDASIITLVLLAMTSTCAFFWKYNVGSYVTSSSELLKVFAYFLFRIILAKLQAVWWRVNGVQRRLQQAEADTGDGDYVQVQYIIWRLRFPAVNHPRPWDFTGLHVTFKRPRALLAPNVTLYCVTATHAYMVETDPGVDVYLSTTSPFIKRAQFKYAKKLYIVPLKHLHKLANDLGDPTFPVIWISNSGRCGSTLLIQMLELIPRTRCLSEPDVTTNISILARTGQLGPTEVEKLLQTVVRFLCKPAPEVRRIAVKVRYTCVTEVKLVMKLFPHFKHMYLYRNMGSVMRSFYKFIHRDLAVCIIERVVNCGLLRSLLPQYRTYLCGLMAGDECKENLSKVLPRVNFMGFATAVVCSNIVVFKAMLERKEIDIPTMHYDEFMKRPLAMTSRLFEELSLPTHYVRPSMDAMMRDSQAGDIASNISNSTNNIRKITSCDINSMNVVLRAMGLPDMNQVFLLPNAIQVTENPNHANFPKMSKEC